MREIKASEITAKTKEMLLSANFNIGEDVKAAITGAVMQESTEVATYVLEQLQENYKIAAREHIAICQDTGMVVAFIKLGQEVHITGGTLQEAIDDGVAAAYEEGYLRKSIVDDPLFERKNTKNNCPAIVHLELVAGDRLEILLTPKGFGSENMSSIAMLTPAAGVEGVKKAVLEIVKKAGPNPCPPMIVGIGIGGTMEKAAIMAKYATARTIDSYNADMRYKQLEEELLEEINALDIGPAGLGGKTTALGVNIEYFPTHIAGLPVAVNICCHAARHAHAIL